MKNKNMIEKKEYKDWSLKFHNDHAKKPIVMQMELTYRCPLHCVHCYADCYNNAADAKKELSTEDVKRLMDKLYEAGCLWFTFTGGDPMTRSDFLELYRYAKDKGFILSIMTSLAGLTDEILKEMSEKPPFSIDMTLNGVTEKTYERISQVKGSFTRVMKNIDKVLAAKLPLKIKTLISKNNIHELGKIKEFLDSKGMTFSPSSLIFARLNGDMTPCEHRLDTEEIIKMNFPEEECAAASSDSDIGLDPQPNRFYRCAIGNWQWHIDPYGALNICSCVRKPSYDIAGGDVSEGAKALSDYVKNKRFSKESECKTCRIWHICHSCPGKAKLELDDEEAPVPYFCHLARIRQTKKEKQRVLVKQ